MITAPSGSPRAMAYRRADDEITSISFLKPKTICNARIQTARIKTLVQRIMRISGPHARRSRDLA